MKSVTIYTTPTCHFCHMAKVFFEENKIPFTEHNVMENADARQEMLDKSKQMGVPVTFIGDEGGAEPEMIIGFDKPRFSALLGIS